MKLNTIKKNEEFKKIYKKGNSIVGAFVVIYRYKVKNNDKKFGITVSKKIGKAVKRNRVRRLIKEVVSKNYYLFKDGYEYVIVARVRANQANFNDVEKNIKYIIYKFNKKKEK